MKKILFIILLFLIGTINAQDKYTCQKVYYLILTNGDFQKLKNEINVTDEQLNNYINNYDVLCYQTNLSDKINQLPKLININNTENCYIDSNHLYIPFFHLSLGNVECQEAKIWNWFFELKLYNNNLTIIGIQIYLILIVILIIFIYEIFKTNSFINRLFNLNILSQKPHL